MKINNKMKLIIIFLMVVVTCSFFLIINNNKIDKLKLLEKKISQQEQKISQQEQKISQQEQRMLKQNKLLLTFLPYLELDKKKSGTDIKALPADEIKLSNNKILKTHQFTSGFYSGISNIFPGSGYIDFFDDNMFVLSSKGVLVYSKSFESYKVNIFKQIKNNIEDFMGFSTFIKSHKFSIKDLLIFDKKIFISYTEEIKEHCWNTSVIYADINFENINFKKFFSPEECAHSHHSKYFKTKNIDQEFEDHQSGGRLISFGENNILLSIGDYRSRHLAQNKKSVNGKLIKINIENGKYKIISMGHRNGQGLYFDKENNFILKTEHGPDGGDEINLIDVEKIKSGKIQNFGWAISSAGEHYGGKTDRNKNKYEKYPLYKSHSEHGFIEPIKSFVPSIAISEIVKINENKYVTSSMGKGKKQGNKSLFFFELNAKREIENLEQVKVFERIRDLKFKDNKLYMFMEDTAKIGVLEF